METKSKIILATCVVIVFAALLGILKYQHDLLQKQDESITELKRLSDNWTRSQTQVVSKKELEDLIDSLDIDSIKEDLEKLDAKIDGIAISYASSSGYHGTNIPSSYTIPTNDELKPLVLECKDGSKIDCGPLDPNGYMTNEQRLSILEPFPDGSNIPFGEVGFQAWNKKPWNLDILKRKYSVHTVIGEDDSGKKYVYNQMSIESNGKSYPLKIDSSKFVEQLPDSKFKFSPRLYLGLSTGAIVNPEVKFEVTPAIEVAFFSYGKTVLSPDWTFLSVGLGVETQARKPALVASPVSFNVGHYLPLVSNLFIGPQIAIDTSASFSVLGGIKVGL